MKRLLSFIAIATLTIALGGCGEPDATTLSGSVTLDGEPVKSGFLLIHGPVNGWVSENIRDGRYRAVSPQLGNVTIVFSNGSPAPVGGAATDPNALVGGIPMKYTVKEMSPLKTEVKEGANTYDVEMVTQ